MNKFINTIIGDLSEKKEYKENERRAKALAPEYAEAYTAIKNYLFATAGLLSFEPLRTLVDLFEEASAAGRHVIDVTGPDVAGFADELVRGEKSYYDTQRRKLNDHFSA
jgi:DNA-binding ferritin-like protein (Dps family)